MMRNLFFLSFISIFLWIGFASAQIESGSVILSWHANTFYPADFFGKPEAVNQSTITLRAEMISDGKIQDLSKARIAWYLDESLYENGVGIKETTFTVTKRSGQRYLVRGVIAIDDEVHESSIIIPISKPKVVIEFPSLENKIGPGETVTLISVPYFFNASSLSDLNFSWAINGKKETLEKENSLTLNIGTPISENQRTVSIQSTVNNERNVFENIQSKIQLFVTQ